MIISKGGRRKEGFMSHPAPSNFGSSVVLVFISHRDSALTDSKELSKKTFREQEA